MKLVYDSWNRTYKSVFGALRRNEPCTFTICLPKTTKLDSNPMMVLFAVGMKERFIPMNTVRENGDDIYYSATCSTNIPGVNYYYFSYMTDRQWQYVKKTGGHEGTINGGDLFNWNRSETWNTNPYIISYSDQGRPLPRGSINECGYL